MAPYNRANKDLSSLRAIDSHCHLQAAAYDADRAEVIGRMREARLGAITVGTNFATSEAAARLASENEMIWAAIAVHPGHLHRPHHDKEESAVPPQEEVFDEARFAELAALPGVVAVGETGLDYYRLEGDTDERREIIRKQRESFRAQIAFAKSRGLPLSMHVRDAYEDALSILKEGGHFAGVMHCFTGTPAEATAFMELGFYVSFSGIVTFAPKKGEKENSLSATVRAVPSERLMIETDAPWLAPAPARGKRNEPLGALKVAAEIARFKGLEREEIELAAKENAIRLFQLAER